MLNATAFGNAFALATFILYLVLYVIRAFAPPLFNLLLNSQFFGANIASQVPNLNLANALGFLIVITALSWVLGYLVAVIYNKSAK